MPSDAPTRAEHIAWCQQRALEYVGQGDLAQALASLQSDLSKHPDTAGHPHIVKGTAMAHAGKLRSPDAMRAFILDIDRPETLAHAWATHHAALPPSLRNSHAVQAVRAAFYGGAKAAMDIGFGRPGTEPTAHDLAHVPALHAELERFTAGSAKAARKAGTA